MRQNLSPSEHRELLYKDFNYFVQWVHPNKNQRKESLLDPNLLLALEQLKAANRAKLTYVVSQPQTTTTAIQPKEENMSTDFHSERSAMNQTLRTTLHAYDTHLCEKHHIHAIHPKSMSHLADLFAKGHYVKPDDKEWNREHRYESPFYLFEFREHPADTKSYDKELKDVKADFDATHLHVSVLEPKESLKSVESFQKKYTVH